MKKVCVDLSLPEREPQGFPILMTGQKVGQLLLVHYDAGRRVLLFQNGGFCDVTPRGQLAGRGSGHQV